MISEIDVLIKVFNLRVWVVSLTAEKKETNEFEDLINFITELWVDYSVKQKEIDKLTAKVHELESKLEMSAKFMGVA